MGKAKIIKMIKFNSKKMKTVRTIVIVLALAGLLFLLKSQVVIAIVNGRPIWRLTYVKTLEKMAGEQVFQNLVTNTLILQEAAKQNIKVSDEEIKAEIDKYKELMKQQGQDFDQILAAQGLSIKDVEESIKTNKLVDKLAGTVEVTEAEIDEYIKANTDVLPKTASQTELKDSVKKQLEQQKLSTKIQELVTALQEKAKIIKWL